MELLWSLIVILGAANLCLSAPAKDEINSLPGLDFPLSFKHYSGYITGSEGKKLHYWFTESKRDPANDPVVIWFNGGPGCSSLLGLFTELGPYIIQEDGETLVENVYSWNSIANVLYLEMPACVGYSYDVNGNCTTDDEENAISNYKALKDFFTNKFPEYRNHELFLTGESYAGFYIPVLTIKILEGQDEFPLNIQGFALGNGITSWRENLNAVFFFGYYHGLYGDTLWSHMVKHCCKGGVPSKDACNFFDSPNPLCVVNVLEAGSIIFGGNLNYYNLYAECKHPKLEHFKSFLAENPMLANTTYAYADAFSNDLQPNLSPPCVDYRYVINYLNKPEFREAAHIPNSVQDWDMCSEVTRRHYHSLYIGMEEEYAYLLPKVRALIFSGDTDMACNFLGSEWFFEKMNLKVEEKRRMWFENVEKKTVGGFVKRFENLDLVTILGAGHMVPEDKPAASLKMLNAFMKKLPY